MDVERFVYVMLTILYTKIQVHYWSTDCAVEGECDSSCGSFKFEDKEFTVKRGDYAPLMEKVCHYLQQAEVRKQRIQWPYSPVCILLDVCNHYRDKIANKQMKNFMAVKSFSTVPLFMLNECLKFLSVPK